MRVLLSILIWFGLCQVAVAQNTSGVFGPVINADDHGIAYRVAAIIDTDKPDEFLWEQRFHYEKAVSGSLRLRGVVALRETNTSEADFDFARLEAVWQVTPDDQDYQSGFRFEARHRGDGRPGEIAAHWTNQWSLGAGWRARAVFLNNLQVTNTTNDALRFSGRFGLSRRAAGGVRMGAHSFIDFGDTNAVRVLNGNEAKVGPFVSFGLTDTVDVYLGTLHGLTSVSDDNQVRVFFGKIF